MLDLLPDPGLEVVLQLTDISDHSCFLVFRRLPLDQDGKQQWEFVDHVDSGWSKYRDVTARALELGGRKYLIVSEASGGTGVFIQWENWYEFQTGDARTALMVAQEFHHAPTGFDWESEVSLVAHREQDDVELLCFEMQLHYFDDPLGFSFRKTIPIIYARHAGDVKFEFQASKSELAPRLAANWPLIPSSHAEDEAWEYGILLGIVRVPDDIRRDWVEEYQKLRTRVRAEPDK